MLEKPIQGNRMARITAVFSVMLTLLVGISCGGSDNTSNQSTNSPLALDETVVTGQINSDENGEALVPLGSDEAKVEIVRQVDQARIPNAVVGYASFIQGTLVWAHTADTFPIIDYISVSETAEQKRTTQAAVTTLVLGGIAVWSVGSAVYEFLTDPPRVIEIIESDDVVKDCISGDLNDILSVFGFVSGAAGISTTLRVLGAPAQLRGVTAINMGIRKANILPGTIAAVGQEFALEPFVETISGVVGILENDVLVGCRPVLGSQEIPFIEINVERSVEELVPQPEQGDTGPVESTPPIITSHTVSSDNTVTVNFSTDMTDSSSLDYFNVWFTPNTYWQDPRTFIIEFDSSAPFGFVVGEWDGVGFLPNSFVRLTPEGFISVSGETLSEGLDVFFPVPEPVVRPSVAGSSRDYNFINDSGYFEVRFDVDMTGSAAIEGSNIEIANQNWLDPRTFNFLYVVPDPLAPVKIILPAESFVSVSGETLIEDYVEDFNL